MFFHKPVPNFIFKRKDKINLNVEKNVESQGNYVTVIKNIKL